MGEISEGGYTLRLAWSCGATFERWVTPDIAERDLLGSRLPAFPNLAPASPRARLMLVALAFVGLKVEPERMPPALRALHRWLDSWTAIGAIERGMYRQGYDLSLARYANEGRRATFYSSGKGHSPTSATGSAWQATP